jgi:hypothetical protein
MEGKAKVDESIGGYDMEKSIVHSKIVVILYSEVNPSTILNVISGFFVSGSVDVYLERFVLETETDVCIVETKSYDGLIVEVRE